jgi:hypothetical protein
MARSSVLLPLPLGPSSTKNSPSADGERDVVDDGLPWYRLVTCSSVIDMLQAPAEIPGRETGAMLAMPAYQKGCSPVTNRLCAAHMLMRGAYR